MPVGRTGVLGRVGNRVKRWTVQARERSRFRNESQQPVQHGPDGLPLPPGRLIRLVAGTDDTDWFLEGGKQAVLSMCEMLACQGVTLERLESILDFGCGSGRVLRHWKSLKGPAIHGTDYNPELVSWCTTNLPFARCRVNRLGGPVDYPAASFGLVYAFSVFTHLTEEGQTFWINELSRVLAPGGFLLLTTHGEHYLPELSSSEQALFRNGQLVVHDSKRAGSNRCAAFHPEAYVRQSLAQGLEVVVFVPKGARGNPWQDAYLLRKPV